MKTTLIIPITGETKGSGPRCERIKLNWTTNHSRSCYGYGVLLFGKRELLDGANFRVLRDQLGAWIESTNPEQVCMALGVPLGEPGVRKPGAAR